MIEMISFTLDPDARIFASRRASPHELPAAAAFSSLTVNFCNVFVTHSVFFLGPPRRIIWRWRRWLNSSDVRPRNLPV